MPNVRYLNPKEDPRRELPPRGPILPSTRWLTKVDGAGTLSPHGKSHGKDGRIFCFEPISR